MSNSKTVQVRIPFTNTDFPELDGVPEPEREALLRRCCNSPEVQALSRQHLIFVRLAFLLIPLGLVVILFREHLNVPEQIGPLIPLIAGGVLVTSFVASVVVFQVRSTRSIKRLIAEELGGRRPE